MILADVDKRIKVTQMIAAGQSNFFTDLSKFEYMDVTGYCLLRSNVHCFAYYKHQSSYSVMWARDRGKAKATPSALNKWSVIFLFYFSWHAAQTMTWAGVSGG